MNFTHLEVTSNYEMNGSNIRINELVEQAKEYGYEALAITDTKMHSAIQFYKACKKHNIKPIIGLKIELEELITDHKSVVLLYAKNVEGYRNLLELASFSAVNGYVKMSELRQYKRGVIAVIKSDYSELLQLFLNQKNNEMNEYLNMLDSHTEEFYFSQSSNTGFYDFFRKDVRFVVANEVGYLNKEDLLIYETLKQIFSVKEKDGLLNDKVTHFLSKEEVKELYNDFLNTSELVDSVHLNLSFGDLLLPQYPLKNNVSSKDYLRALSMKGLELRLKGKRVNRRVYQERLEYELSVIDQMGYNDYFLIVWDFVKYAKKQKYLVGPGRGSAAASLVSYCLGITNVDSIEYDLVFERFLNPERVTMPDIDMDLPDDKRDDIITYVRDFYGMDKVASICTFGTFLKKSALRETAKIYGIEGVLLTTILKESESYSSIAAMNQHSTLIQNIMNQNDSAKTMLEVASQIEGLNKHVSTHAAGIIVSKERLMRTSPVQIGLLDMFQTQFGAKDLESLGLLKIDFLGLRNLSSIDRIVNQINEKEKVGLNIYQVPLNDKLTFDLLKKVETTGVFQLESKGMRSLIREMQIDCFEDIVTCLALFRPGPMENIPSYIRRRFKEEEVSYPHTLLKPILEPTNGIIIYQEQIIQIAAKFAGYSLGEADVLRRAVSKKQQKVLNQERVHFVEKAKTMGREEKVSNEIYDYIVKFANYGFNRAHSVAYAMVSYWMAYLKANYPKHFIGVLTSSVIGSESMMKEYIFEAKKIGVDILKPSVNFSSHLFVPEGDHLRYPLLGIKNVGRNTVRDLLHIREEEGLFKSFVDFVSRVQGKLNKRVIESLIYAGALDEFGYSKKAMITQLEDVMNFSLYGGFIDQNEFVIHNVDEFPFEVLYEKEKEVIGFDLFVNPLNEYEEFIKKHQLYKVSDINKGLVGKEIRILAMLSKQRKIITKNGDEMAFATLSDQSTRLDSVLFTRQYKEFKDELKNNEIYLLKGQVDYRNDKLQFIINNLKLM